MEPPRIRDAESTDLALVTACVTAAYRPYLERMPTASAPLLDDYASLIDHGVVRLAESGSDIVGVIVMWSRADHFYVDNVAVDPSMQGQGVGAALLDDAERAARQRGHGEIRLYTNEVMVENLEFHPRRGFTVTHRKTENGYKRVYFRRLV